jgi:hypothetical protein
MPEETAKTGWESLSELTGIHKRTLYRRRTELLAAGAIFYIKHGKRKAKAMCYFPSSIKIFLGLKSSRNTFI